MTSFLRVSHPSQEGALRVSKALKHQFLLSEEGMRALFQELSPFFIYDVSGVVSEASAQISHDEFLKGYAQYIQTLKSGIKIDPREYRKLFSSVFTQSKEILYAMQVGPDKYLIKPLKPVIQLQMHFFMYSRVDHKFHSMNAGQNSVSWGLQVSYPQIYQDPQTHSYARVDESIMFPNTSLYKKMAKWIRYHTAPTKLRVEEKEVFEPFRIGKLGMDWIHAHPDLIQERIQVV